MVGNPTPNITWFQDGYRMPPEKSWSNHRIEKNVLRVTMDESAEFTCMGSNGVGEVANLTYRVSVYGESFLLYLFLCPSLYNQSRALLVGKKIYNRV